MMDRMAYEFIQADREREAVRSARVAEARRVQRTTGGSAPQPGTRGSRLRDRMPALSRGPAAT